MRVFTAAEMREVDRRTVSLGIPDAVLMENAGHRVVELLAERFAPLERQRIVILCGKGNNGGDGIVVARQLFTRFRPASLDVVLADAPPGNLRSLEACGFTAIHREIAPTMRAATIVIDALLGTGLAGLPRPPYLDLIHQVNTGFPAARIVAVDIPSGMDSDSAKTGWPHVRANYTVTFTAPMVGMVLEPNASACGELIVGAIGSPESILPAHTRLTEPRDFAARLFASRPADGHKGTFGHVLVAGGSPGKSGAVAMAGLAALRAGAGLVTVASDPSILPAVAAHAPELMTAPLDEQSFAALAKGKRALALGPGYGVSSSKRAFLERVIAEHDVPTVIDADGLNNLSSAALPRRANLILTPHPGEMERLTGKLPSIGERLPAARAFAQEVGVTLVLKGHDTLTAFPDGTVWINSTGGPAMATGGSGDILTGLIAGLAAQFPESLALAVVAAVWLHGRAGELAAADLGEKCVIATDLLRYLPQAMKL
jgi:ADP-dependent NAD(P)H-hydrate dehydratase / NAD(P)H-hydrate epimerase